MGQRVANDTVLCCFSNYDAQGYSAVTPRLPAFGFDCPHRMLGRAVPGFEDNSPCPRQAAVPAKEGAVLTLCYLTMEKSNHDSDLVL